MCLQVTFKMTEKPNEDRTEREMCTCGFPQSSPEPHEHSKELSLQKTSEEIANRLIEAKTKGNWIESPVRIMKWLPADKVD